ncbi:MAG: flagellin [Campylobacterota bacterium]|nr:flagellin [Campylobacterota bacterium]
MRINTNIASMTAQANNAQVNKNLNNSLEKLSSGLRINKAADDASGMAIADKLRTQASSLGQGISNANSGSSMIQIADKAMGEVSNILDIVKTKLIQASTSTTSEEGKEAIRKDIVKLLDQLDSISETTTYNGVNLLNEKNKEFSFQIGEYADSKVSMITEYAVNTAGLGSTSDIPVDADATLNYGATGSVAIKENDTTLTVQNSTTQSVDRAIIVGSQPDVKLTAASDSTFTISATGVESFVMNTSAAVLGAAEVTLETSDQETIDLFNAIAQDNPALTKNADGNYTLKNTAANESSIIDFGGSKVDFTDLKVSGMSIVTGGTAQEAISIETDDEVSVTKIGGAGNLSVDAATQTTANTATSALTASLSGNGSTNPDGIVYGTTAGHGVILDSGTATVQVDQSLAGVSDATIGVNTILETSSNDEGSFVVTATEVEMITMSMTAGTGSVVLTTDDIDTMIKLSELAQYDENLTKIQDGMYSFTATAANTDAVLEFGTDKIDISNLTFSNVQNGTAAGLSEVIYIQTDMPVSVTKNGEKDAQDISLAAFSGAGATAIAERMVGVRTDTSTTDGSLAGLKGLSENELTAETALSYMDNVDEAINQINNVRSDFGSTQIQLEAAVRNMLVTQVNIKAAESVIRDVDYAAESANFNKQNIISQAGTYALSQANNVQQNVMKLLQ